MRRFCVLAAVSLAVASLHAADPTGARLESLFTRFDADGGGSLTAEEQKRALAFVERTHGGEWSRRVGRLFSLAAGSERSVAAAAWREQVAAYVAPPVRETVMLPMRDGKRLATDIYRPRGGGPYAVVLTRTPYDRTKRGGEAEGFTRDGLAFVSQDMRGRFASEGENLPFVGCGWGACQDGVDTLAWLRRQPWCDGRIGTVGGSAGGITQNLLAGAAPEGLRAQYITVAAASLYTDAAYIGGAFRKADMENWLNGNKFAAEALGLMRGHPCYDEYWQPYDTALKVGEMTAPAVHVGGWFDMFAQGTLDAFAARQQRGGAGARGAQKLVMGPWTHGVGKMPVGELTFPGAGHVPEAYSMNRWFSHHLLGEANGIDREPAVTYYVMGDVKTPGAPGNVWRTAAAWPVPATETAFYFTQGKQLAPAPASGGEAFVAYVFEPTNPCPTVGGHNLTLARGPMDQRPVEGRPDVVTFTSAPLGAPLEVTGRVKARVFVSSSAADTDLSVRLCDVYPDGASYLMAEGILRLRYRRSVAKPEPLTPGQVEEVEVDCWSTSLVFNQGHRIRVTVTSSNYPRFDVNPGTGAAWADGVRPVTQSNRIYCDAMRPSRVLLPVVGGKGT